MCVNFNFGYFLQDATEWFFFQSHSVQLQFLKHSTVAFVATISHLWWHIFLCRKYFPEFNTYSISVNLAACTFTVLVHLHTCNLPSKLMEYLVNNLIIYLNFQSMQTWQNKMKVSYLYTPVKYICCLWYFTKGFSNFSVQPSFSDFTSFVEVCLKSSHEDFSPLFPMGTFAKAAPYIQVKPEGNKDFWQDQWKHYFHHMVWKEELEVQKTQKKLYYSSFLHTIPISFFSPIHWYPLLLFLIQLSPAVHAHCLTNTSTCSLDSLLI